MSTTDIFSRLSGLGLGSGGGASASAVNATQREAVGRIPKMEQTQHDEYYTHLKKEVAARMAAICDFHTIPSTRKEVTDCLACALEHGDSAEEIAEMHMLVTEWLHACHEVHEHHTKKG